MAVRRPLRAAGEIAALLLPCVRVHGGDSRIITTADDPPPGAPRPRAAASDAVASALEAVHLPLRRRSLRLVISDFLFPHDADALVDRLARDSASLAIVQLTLAEEADPEAAGGLRLIDVEGRGEIDMVVDAAAVRDYRARFGRLRSGLSRASRRSGARFAHVVAGTPVREVARRLAAAGVLEPA